MSERFQICLRETLFWEGGYSNHPKDPGGPTMCGILQPEYDSWRGANNLPSRPVRQSDEFERDRIYFEQYWQPIRGDDLPKGLDLELFDFGVLSGPGTAIRTLQKTVGVKPDGHIGLRTLAAVRAYNGDLVADLSDARLRCMKQAKNKKGELLWPTFGRGWDSRRQGIEAAACDVAPTAALGLIMPLADIDAQSETQGRARIEPPSSTLATPTGKAAAAFTLAGILGVIGALKVAIQGAVTGTKPIGDAAMEVAGALQDPQFAAFIGMLGAAVVAWRDRAKIHKDHAV
jgi:lysozyme family protein